MILSPGKKTFRRGSPTGAAEKHQVIAGEGKTRGGGPGFANSEGFPCSALPNAPVRSMPLHVGDFGRLSWEIGGPGWGLGPPRLLPRRFPAFGVVCHSTGARPGRGLKPAYKTGQFD